jgi:hypothetical protein
VGNQNTIELNGKRYDALTGRIIGESEHAKSSYKTHNAHNNQVIDGFTRRPGTALHKKTTRNAPNTLAGQVHKKTQKAKTLMRGAVQKPAAKHPEHSTKPHTGTITSKPPTLQPADPRRLLRASHIKKSLLISRFGSGQANTVTTRLEPLAVRPEPTPASSIPAKHSSLARQASAIAKPSKADQFAAAIAKANSHDHPKPKKTRLHHRVAKKLHVKPRIISVAASLAAAVLIGGFFAYQNIPNINMRIAKARSGVSGSLPGYKPSGFAIKTPIDYKPGQITINFKSNSDDRRFSITQEKSNWTSETLLSSLKTKGEDPLTIEDKGKTIYLYNESNASWVNSGVKYKIEGNSSLNTDQLRRLASSM